MKKSTINKKLKSYSALAGSLVAANATGNAQTIYTDVNPDTTIITTGGLYNLDLNNDDIYDYRFSLTINPPGTSTGGSPTNGSSAVGVNALDSNKVAGSTAGAYIYPFALNAGDTVQASLTFNAGSAQSMASYFGASYTYGNWPGVVDKYIGLQLKVDTLTYYGWARLSVDSTGSSFTLKDYAYNTVPNAYIIAGNTGVGIAENILMKDVLIYCYDKNITIKLLNELPVKGDIKVTNMLGQEVYAAALTNKEMHISLEDKKPGIYLISVTQGTTVYTRKINLQ